MPKCDIIYQYYSGGTNYRLRPNPDVPPESGYQSGGVLEYRDEEDTEWSKYFFMPVDALEAMGRAMIEASKIK